MERMILIKRCKLCTWSWEGPMSKESDAPRKCLQCDNEDVAQFQNLVVMDMSGRDPESGLEKMEGGADEMTHVEVPQMPAEWSMEWDFFEVWLGPAMDEIGQGSNFHGTSLEIIIPKGTSPVLHLQKLEQEVQRMENFQEYRILMCRQSPPKRVQIFPQERIDAKE